MSHIHKALNDIADLVGYSTWTDTPEAYIAALAERARKALTLEELDKVENEAFQTMLTGSEEDARSVWGEEGKNYLAWCHAADACRNARDEH